MKKTANLLISIILFLTVFTLNAYATDIEEAPTPPPEVEIYWDGGVEIVPPDKTTYVEGEILDLTGFEVYGTSGETYTDGTSKVTYRKPIQFYTIDLENVPLTVDNTTVTVTGIHPLMQATVSGTFEITVLPETTPSPYPTTDPSMLGYLTFDKETGTITKCDTSISGDLVIPAEIDGVAVTEIGSSAFASCRKLTSVTVPGSVNKIGNYAFYNEWKLETVTIYNGVTSIGDTAFGSCKVLTSVSIPNSVTSIGDDAFYYCSKLEDVTIPSNLTELGDYAFKYCTALTNITIPGTLSNIPADAFYGDTNLTSVTIEYGVESIGTNAFYGCKGLTEIELPESVESISDNAFANCETLKKVVIPESVTSIGANVFSGTSAEFAIYGYGDSYAKTYADENGIAFVDMEAPELNQAEKDYNISYYIGGIGNVSTADKVQPYGNKITYAAGLEVLSMWDTELREEIIAKYDDAFFKEKFLIVISWVELQDVRLKRVGEVNVDEDDFSIVMSEREYNEEVTSVIAPYCAILEVPISENDKALMLDGKYFYVPPICVLPIYVPAPEVDTESGMVAYGTEITISPVNNNSVAYSINGSEFVYEKEAVKLSITEDTELVVKSRVDNPDPNPDAQYMIDENTYTYTIDPTTIPVVDKDLITGTVTLPDGITAPEGGMKINIYTGNIRYSGGGGYWFTDKYLEYPGITTTVPTDTINKNIENMTDRTQTSIVIPEGERSISFSVPYSTTISKKLVCIIDNDTYIGNSKPISLHLVNKTKIQISCEKKSKISGKITIPKSDSDTVVTIVAEGNIRIEDLEKGNDFAATKKLTIPAGETSIDYSLSVKENMEYTVYVVFTNKEYKRPVKNINITTGEYTADFDSFEKSNKISATVKLPDGITDFQFLDGESIEDVSGYAYLQSASYPYYYLDVCSFVIETGNTTASVELYDDIGVEDVYISYKLATEYKNIYFGGMYVDDTKCVPNIKYAPKIKSESKDIVLNIIKANTVNVQIENKANTYFYLDAIVQRNKNDFKDAENSELMVEVIDYSEDMSEAYVNIPEEYNYYILRAKFEDTLEVAYLTEKGYSRNIQNAKVFSVKDTELDFTWNGYDPIHAFSVSSKWYPEENGDFYDCKMTITNQSDFAKEDAKMYAILFDADGQFTGAFVNEPFSIESKEEQTHTISIPTEDYNKAEKIYVMFWNGVKPLSKKIPISKNIEL